MQENKASVPQMNPYQNQFTAPPKSMRISDLYFPDPMFYPGYYPTGMNNQYGQYNMYQNNGPQSTMPNMMNFQQQQQQQQPYPYYDLGNKRNNNYEQSRVNNVQNQLPKRNSGRFNALQDFVSTVHRIHNPGRK